MADNEPKQRGRKSGSVSFMQVELSELNRVLKPSAKVIISLKYAVLVGLEGKPVGGDMTVYNHCVNSGNLGATLETFGEDGAPAAPIFKDGSEEEEMLQPKENKGEDLLPPAVQLQSWNDAI